MNNKSYMARATLMFLGIGFLIYFNSLFNNFVGDDYSQIINNPLVHSLSTIPQLFSQGNFYDASDTQRNNYYKPILSITTAIIYAISGDSPFGYHLISVTLHIANTLLLYLLLTRHSNEKSSLIISLIFLVHPLNNEAVVYASNMQELLFTLFGLLALYLRVSWKTTLLLLLSVLSKETGVIFLIIVPIYNYLFNRTNFTKSVWSSLSAASVYGILRFTIGNNYFPQNPVVPIMTLSFGERILNIPKIIYFYAKTFFYPRDLIVFQTWIVKNPNFSDFVLPLLIDLFFAFVITVFGVWLYKRDRKRFPTFCFFISWLILGLVVHLQIVPLDQTVADRWFYFPMAGLLGATGVFLKYLGESNERLFKTFTMAMSAAIVVFGIRVMVRNTNWKDQLTLYSHDIQKNQSSHQLEMGLANAYFSQGDISKAEKHYKKSAELFPFVSTYSNLGLFYLANERFVEAETAFSEVLKYNASLSQIWMTLAISKHNLGDKEGALAAINRAISISQSKTNLLAKEKIVNNLELKPKIVIPQ